MSMHQQKLTSINNRMRVSALFTLIGLLFLTPLLSAQQNSVEVNAINIIGNKKTKERIIYRELDIYVGSEISATELEDRLNENERLVLNTGMFSKVDIMSVPVSDSNKIDIDITVRENWYIYPIPLVELADRNFNVWLVEQNAALDRLNIVLRMHHLNLTGNGDRLKILTQIGYTQKLEVEYSFPGINKAQTLGVTVNSLFTRNKEIGYTSFENKLLFDRNDEVFQLKRVRLGGGVRYRPGILFYHNLRVNYHQNQITDSVAINLNADYFLDAKKQQQFVSVNYNFIYDNRDIKPYPIKGSYANIGFQKQGVGIFDDRNSFRIIGEMRQYYPLHEKWSATVSLKAQVEMVRKKHGYYNSRALGYFEDFVRGYQYYVIDGQDYGLVKSSLRYKVFDREIKFGKWVFIEQFRVAPLKVYLTANYDGGYVWDKYYFENNTLSNSYLQGGSVGVDFVVYYDKVLRIEYSLNALNEKGLFLHYNLSF